MKKAAGSACCPQRKHSCSAVLSVKINKLPSNWKTMTMTPKINHKKLISNLKTETDAAAVILVVCRRMQYHLWPHCGLQLQSDTVRIFARLLQNSQKKKQLTLFMTAEEISQSRSRLQTYFTDSNSCLLHKRVKETKGQEQQKKSDYKKLME